MRWSWTIARIKGIDVDIHATFLLLLAWIALADYQMGHTTGAAMIGILFTIAIFASVVLHEFGHALTAARFGVKTKSITLLPIGGVARLERMPSRPREELVIALAGPAVTVAIVIVLYIVLQVARVPLTSSPQPLGFWSFVAQVMWVNVVLAFFNLLPAFPMDGGRVLRAALALKMPFDRATEFAARVGKAFALLFALFGLFVVNNPFLVIIGVFVWLSAAAEAHAVHLKSTVSNVAVERAMITDVRMLAPTESVSTAIDEVRSGFQHDFPVVNDNAIEGVLTREGLLRAMAEGHGDERVGDVMQRNFCATTPDESLERALQRLQEGHCQAMPVLRGRQVIGLLTAEKIQEFLLIDAAARAGRKAA